MYTPTPDEAVRARADLITALAFVALRPQVQDAVDTIRLPLEHTELIREQSREKGIDPALVAAVIGAVVPMIVLALSPIPKLREMPQAPVTS